VLRRFGNELLRHDGHRLSERAVAVLQDACNEARRQGVKPERLIVLLKEEVRAAVGNDDFRRRLLVDESVRRCIHLFFAPDATS
jgi:hypothetical protein